MKLVRQLINVKIAACLFACNLGLSVALCNSYDQYDLIVSKPVTQPETLLSQDQITMEKHLISSDLNAQDPSVRTRGFISNVTAGLAGAAGCAVGSSIGAWTGSILGSVAGPWGAIVGHLIGHKVGPYVCGPLAAGVVAWLLSRRPIRDVAHVDKKFEFVSLISDKDSTGYYQPNDG